MGYMGAASVANVGGLDLLGIITVPTDLLTLLSATVPPVYYADVSAVDDWGFYVSGNGGRSAGGFAGFLQGAQVGMKYTPAVIDASSGSHVGTPDETILGQNVSVTGLRSVTGGDYAGGFFGYADAAETLDVSAPDEGGSNENFTLRQMPWPWAAARTTPAASWPGWAKAPSSRWTMWPPAITWVFSAPC